MFPYVHKFVLLVFCSDNAHVLQSAGGGQKFYRAKVLGGKKLREQITRGQKTGGQATRGQRTGGQGLGDKGPGDKTPRTIQDSFHYLIFLNIIFLYFFQMEIIILLLIKHKCRSHLYQHEIAFYLGVNSIARNR